MASINFDGATKCIGIQLSALEDFVTIKVSDIYRAWKNWVMQSDNLKYEQAMRSVGGEPLSDVERLGSAFFLTQLWRLCPIPLQNNSRIVLDGNMFADPSTNPILDYYMVPSGLHTHVEMRTSTLPVTMITQVNTGSGLSAEERLRLFSIPTSTLELDERTAVLAASTDAAAARSSSEINSNKLDSVISISNTNSDKQNLAIELLSGVPSVLDIDNQLTSNHGSGSWVGGGVNETSILTELSGISNTILDISNTIDTALPVNPPGTNGGLPTVDSNNSVKLQVGAGPNQINLSNGRVDLGSIYGKTQILDNLSGSLSSMIIGTVTDQHFTPTTNRFELLEVGETTANHFNGRVCIFITGPLSKQACLISGYYLENTYGRFSVSPLTENPSAGDKVIIV